MSGYQVPPDGQPEYRVRAAIAIRAGGYRHAVLGLAIGRNLISGHRSPPISYCAIRGGCSMSWKATR